MIFKNGALEKNDTIDCSSLFGAFMFGLFELDSTELKMAAETTIKTFGATEDYVVGLPRYENDYYQRVDPNTHGNWWYITTLWLAQYYLEAGKVSSAHAIIDWVIDKSMDSGVLSEQISPRDGGLISVAPLTWSHAEFIATLLDTINEKD
ncbi:hypothetical protein B7Z17_05270 [Candidatus Saccharibacteria bacterium 32-49-10]|nr:MAG: hypothetical protein B7Z17_05270 [Candidatus Saccharibacteria bacterium 32-49-10]